MTVLLLAGCARDLPPLVQAPQPPAYDYPIENPYAATIIGTPKGYRWGDGKIRQPDERALTVYPDRVIPEGFWYHEKLLYGVMLQDKPASLIYIIAGTGASYRSKISVAMANMLYRAGHHVVMLPSPTHPDFIVSASSDFYPGDPRGDAEDIYHLMTTIHAQLKAEGVVMGDIGVTGYSLGAWDAAFVAHLDARAQKLNITRTLLLNPPLDLHASVERLDGMLLKGLPDGVDGLDKFIDRVLRRLSKMRADGDALDFSNENLLYEAYQKARPSDASMQTTIGMAFRFSAASMIFTTDVMSHAGYIYPADKPFTSLTRLNQYLAVALRTEFEDYFTDMYIPHMLKKYPGITVDELTSQVSLESIGDWINSNPNIGLIGNRDDVILDSDEVAKLENMFGDRAVFFPTGGHMGNVEHPAFVWEIVSFFAGMKP